MKKKILRNIFIVSTGILLGIYALSLIFPLAWSVMTSFKGRFDLLGNQFGLPKEFKFENYLTAIQGIEMDVPMGQTKRTVNMLEMLFNSVVYSVGCAFVSTFMTCLVSYLVAKYDFAISKIIYVVVVVTMVIPVIGALPSEMQIMSFLNLKNSILGVLILKSSFLGMYFLLFHAQFKNISNEYSQAASIDGASHTKIMFQIIFPLIKGTFMVVFLIQFINFWNDYQIPMLYLQNMPTASYGLYMLNANPKGNGSDSIPVKLASCIIVSLPIVVIFCIFKDKMMGNFTMGGLKG